MKNLHPIVQAIICTIKHVYYISCSNNLTKWKMATTSIKPVRVALQWRYALKPMLFLAYCHVYLLLNMSPNLNILLIETPCTNTYTALYDLKKVNIVQIIFLFLSCLPWVLDDQDVCRVYWALFCNFCKPPSARY